MQQIKGSVVNSMILGRNHFCCLCFKTVADFAVHIEDKVIIKKHDNTYDEVYMTDIITTVLGPEICDQLSIFNAVCNQCSSGAINSYKFYIKCKDNLQNLGHIIDGLTNGTEILCQTNSSVKAGFVYINTENYQYRGYNSFSTASTGLLAYRKFQNLQCKYEFTNKPAMKFVPRVNYRTNEEVKILRLRLVRLNPMVLNKHSRVFVCPMCDQFFVRRNSMHLHYRKKHLSVGEDFPFISSQYVIKTNECDNLTNSESYGLWSEPIIKTNESHSVISQVKVKMEPEENGFAGTPNIF